MKIQFNYLLPATAMVSSASASNTRKRVFKIHTQREIRAERAPGRNLRGGASNVEHYDPWLDFPRELKEASMSMGFLTPAEMSISMGLTPAEMSMSMGLVPAEMSMSMGLAPAEMSMSMGLTPAEMSMSMGLAPAEMSMSMGLTPAEISMSMGLTPAEMSMSMGLVPVEFAEKPVTEAESVESKNQNIGEEEEKDEIFDSSATTWNEVIDKFIELINSKISGGN